jgi:hypothetical protein
MTNDLVKRLRKQISGASQNDRRYERPMSWNEAETILDRIEELEAALRDIETLELDPRNSGQMWVEALRQIAREALEDK